MMSVREIQEILSARNTSDGAGVKLKRVFGGPGPERFDPFLMLDELGSDEPVDYLGGFPDHPHRGFETVTYLMRGKMEHRDHLGNVGLLQDGGVQWMTAGRGIIHSEMPKQTEGRLHGFQLWVNLPAEDKMNPAGYQDINGDLIPLIEVPGARIKAIAGEFSAGDQRHKGYYDSGVTEVVFLHITLEAGKAIQIGLPAGDTCLLYLFEGHLISGTRQTPLDTHKLARFSAGDTLFCRNDSQVEAQCLMLAGKPLGEPIAQYGPFVMNTMEEVEQAIKDYQAGTLTSP